MRHCLRGWKPLTLLLLQSINQLFYFAKSINQSSNQITSNFKGKTPFLNEKNNKKCPGFSRPENGHPTINPLSPPSHFGTKILYAYA